MTPRPRGQYLSPIEQGAGLSLGFQPHPVKVDKWEALALECNSWALEKTARSAPKHENYGLRKMVLRRCERFCPDNTAEAASLLALRVSPISNELGGDSFGKTPRQAALHGRVERRGREPFQALKSLYFGRKETLYGPSMVMLEGCGPRLGQSGIRIHVSFQ